MPFSQIIPPSPSPTESTRLFYTSVSLLLSHTEETRIERDTCTPMFIAALFIIARTRKQPRLRQFSYDALLKIAFLLVGHVTLRSHKIIQQSNKATKENKHEEIKMPTHLPVQGEWWNPKGGWNMFELKNSDITRAVYVHSKHQRLIDLYPVLSQWWHKHLFMLLYIY